eukprot:5079473-Prymnesium_polylepis.1
MTPWPSQTGLPPSTRQRCERRACAPLPPHPHSRLLRAMAWKRATALVPRPLFSRRPPPCHSRPH